MRFQRGRTSAKKGKTNELTCLREVFVFGDAHNPYAIGRTDGAGRLCGLLPAHHDGACEGPWRCRALGLIASDTSQRYLKRSLRGTH
jgi:hypothetical protein